MERDMTMQGSEAIAISAVINDAVTELRIVENLVTSSFKSAGRKDDKYYEKANFTHMNKILSKFSCYAHDKSSMHRKHTLQNNNNAAAGVLGVNERIEATLEDCFNSAQYVRKLKAHIYDRYLYQVICRNIHMRNFQHTGKHHILARQRESRDKIKELRSEIERQTKEGMQLVEQSKETIAHLKDQVQVSVASTQ
ncbi:hypothetical protein AHF37_05528 [Paragonimus kellicotti]|nr:hypothetical protein AHF37_05528 [Paragonimus kellicotti]